MTTLGQKQKIFTRNIGKLIMWATDRGYELTFGEAYRTVQQQAIHYASGASRVKHSPHQDKLAVDFNLFIGGVYQQKSEAYAPLGGYWESLDPANLWGGSFPRVYGTAFVDGNHFEMR